MAKNPNAQRLKEIAAATKVLYKEYTHLENVLQKLQNKGEVFMSHKIQRRLDELTNEMFNLDNEAGELK